MRSPRSGAAEHLPRGVRPRRRRPGADRQQERQRRTTTAISTTTAATRALNANNFFTNRPNVKKPRYRFNTYGANLGGPVPKAEKKLFFFYSIEAPLVSRPGPLRNWTMPTDARDAGRLLADARRPGPAHQHQGSAARRARATRRPADRAASPATSSRPTASTRTGCALLNMLPRANNFDRTFTQGQFNYSTQENAENPKMNNIVRVDWRPTRERQLLLHLQGLVLGPARQRDHRRPGQVGLLQHALPEHRSRRQRELHEDHPVEPRPRHRLRHPSADRAVLPADRRGLGPDQPRHRRLHASASSIPS